MLLSRGDWRTTNGDRRCGRVLKPWQTPTPDRVLPRGLAVGQGGPLAQGPVLVVWITVGAEISRRSAYCLPGGGCD